MDRQLLTLTHFQSIGYLLSCMTSTSKLCSRHETSLCPSIYESSGLIALFWYETIYEQVYTTRRREDILQFETDQDPSLRIPFPSAFQAPRVDHLTADIHQRV